MLLIQCIYCGERDETEFDYGGEVLEQRPLEPDNLYDNEWDEFLF